MRNCNSGGSPGHGPCWLLRYGPEFRHLDEVADDLGLCAGMVVTLFYEEEYEGHREAFEVSAVLEDHPDSNVRWQALPDWTARRDLSGPSADAP
jgi:hypothetical protein